MGRDVATFYDPRSRKRRFIRNLAMIGTGVLLVGILAWNFALVARPAAAPALSRAWHEQIYSLDEAETVRFVPPPYTPERRNQSTQQKGFVLYRQNSISEIDRDYWDWAHRIQPGGLFFGNRLMPSRPIGNLKAAMEFAALGRWPDVVVAEELKDIRADGDWIVRGITSLDQRMMALQSVLKLITGRDLVIQYELVEHEVDDWELSLENRGSLKVIKDRQLHPGIVMRERVAKAGS